VSFEGVPFSKPANLGSFLEAFVIPANTQDVSVDGTRQRNTGVFQVNVWSKTGVGAKEGEDIANAIKAAFPVVPKTGTVSVESTPSIKQAILDASGYRIIPIIIPYRQEIQS
jgi:hypothetical protein